MSSFNELFSFHFFIINANESHCIIGFLYNLLSDNNRSSNYKHVGLSRLMLAHLDFQLFIIQNYFKFQVVQDCAVLGSRLLASNNLGYFGYLVSVHFGFDSSKLWLFKVLGLSCFNHLDFQLFNFLFF